MKLIIDIPEEDYKNRTLINYFKCYSTELDKIIYDGTPLEAQPNRCDSCIHSEEQDGSNCYECVKGMADNFEAQSTEIIEQTELKPSYNSVKFELEQQPSECTEHPCLGKLCRYYKQPCEDAISRQAAIDFIIDNYGLKCSSLTNGIRDYLPPVTPQPKIGKWIQTKDECDGVNFYDFSFECSKCGKEQSFKSNYCPNCGAEMNGGGEVDGK